MAKKLFNNEEIEFLKNNFEGKFAREITPMFNKKFNRNVSMRQIQYWRENHKIKSNVYASLLTNDEIEYLKDICIGRTTEEIVELFKNKFNKIITRNQVYVFKRKYNIKTGVDCKFKKGKSSHNTRPIGSEFTTTEKDRKQTMVKTSKNKWKRKQVYIWEKHNGKIPKNGVIIFLDGNRDNFNIDNLQMITRHESNIMAGSGLYFKNKQLNKTSIAIAKLKSKISEIERND